MKKSFATLSLIIILGAFLNGCGADTEEDTAETDTPEEIAAQEDVDFTGVWRMVIYEGDGGTIVNTAYAYADGMVESVSGEVTTPEGITGYPNFRSSGQNWATYQVSGRQIMMTAINGSSTMYGAFSDENHASGYWTSGAGSYDWNATRTGDLPDIHRIIGTWTFEMNGYDPEMEINRWQQVHLNSDGTADVDYQKAQMQGGQIYEGEIPDYFESYTFDGTNVVIEGDLTFIGEMSIDSETGLETIQGTWVNDATGDGGNLFGVKVGLQP